LTRGHCGGEGDEVATAGLERIHGENCNQPIAVIIDGRFRNVASFKTQGVDVLLDYFLDTARGKVTFSLNGTIRLTKGSR